MENFTAEASSQARGYTRCGSELIVNEIATGTSTISHQDAFQVALKLAQQKADATLKEELMKIDMGNEPCKMLRGRDGLPGSRGKRGEKGDPGTFPFQLPSQFLGDNTFVIPDELLTAEQKGVLDSIAARSRYIQAREAVEMYVNDLNEIQSKFGDILKDTYNTSTSECDLAETSQLFTTNYRISDINLINKLVEGTFWLYKNYPDSAECLALVRYESENEGTKLVRGGGGGWLFVTAAILYIIF